MSNIVPIKKTPRLIKRFKRHNVNTIAVKYGIIPIAANDNYAKLPKTNIIYYAIISAICLFTYAVI